MDRATRASTLAKALQQAGARRDWPGLKRLDAEIAAQVRLWATDSAWTAAEQQALAQLRAAHRQVSAQCEAEVRALGQTLVRINNQQGRWQAYSQSSHWGDSGL